jgi:hypothetical protein
MRAIVFNPSITRMMGLVSIPFALVAAFAVYPMGSHGHGKGIYQSKADAEQRASEIGCKTVHQNNGKWMPCADERELHRQLRKQ